MSFLTLSTNNTLNYRNNDVWFSSELQSSTPFRERIQSFKTCTYKSFFFLATDIIAIAESILKSGAAIMCLDRASLKFHAWVLITRPLALLIEIAGLVFSLGAFAAPNFALQIHQWSLRMAQGTSALPYLKLLRQAAVKWSSEEPLSPYQKALTSKAWVELYAALQTPDQMLRTIEGAQHWSFYGTAEDLEYMRQYHLKLDTALKLEKLLVQSNTEILKAHEFGVTLG